MTLAGRQTALGARLRVRLHQQSGNSCEMAPLKREVEQRLSMSLFIMDQAKIQAQVLVPLVKVLQRELGEQRANAVVRKALGDIYRRYGQEFWRTKGEANVGKAMASAFTTIACGDALDYQVREQSQDLFAIDVTGCRYAEFYKGAG